MSEDENYFVRNGCVDKILEKQSPRDQVVVSFPTDHEAVFSGFKFIDLVRDVLSFYHNVIVNTTTLGYFKVQWHQPLLLYFQSIKQVCRVYSNTSRKH